MGDNLIWSVLGAGLLAVALLSIGYFKLKARAQTDASRYVSRGARW